MSKDDLKIVGSCTYTNQDTQEQRVVEYTYSYDDLHDMPWQLGDEDADREVLMRNITTMRDRFEQRVEDMVWGQANEEWIMESNFVGEELADWYCDDGEWTYHIEGGTWEDFVQEDLKRFIEGEDVNG